ncbi:unnamed protein product [Sphagnum tenellum]
MMLMASSLDLIVLFIALELMSLAVYILVGFRRADRRSNEAAMKYFILGSAASAVLLYGSALLYGATGSTGINEIFSYAKSHPESVSPIFILGAALVLFGFLFKVAASPFHMWMPDVYEGAPVPITGFMTTGLKAAAFASFIRVFVTLGYGKGLSVSFQEHMHSIMWVSAVLTMGVGNFIALSQTNLKRMLAYSSIAHTGYLLVGMISGAQSELGYAPAILYLLMYGIMNAGAFIVLTFLATRDEGGLNLHDLSELLLARASGNLKAGDEVREDAENPNSGGYSPILGRDEIPPGETLSISETGADQDENEPTLIGEIQGRESFKVDDGSEDITKISEEGDRAGLQENQNAEKLNAEKQNSSQQDAEDKDTDFISLDRPSGAPGDLIRGSSWVKPINVAEEKTVVFQKPKGFFSVKKLNGGERRKVIRKVLLYLALAVSAYLFYFDESDDNPSYHFSPVHPQLPSVIQGQSDPLKSDELYKVAMKDYLADTALGYRQAESKLREALSYNISNVKALAMLASCYINLIDSSNKDENYFAVLTRLIDMSREKSVDLAETVIADVEFYLTVGKSEVAQRRIVEYTQTHASFGVEMFYYLALAFHSRGDENSAVKYLSLIPSDKVFSSKIYYLRGQVAEALNDFESAKKEYKNAIAFNRTHGRSHLHLAQLLYKLGSIKEAEPQIEFLVSHLNLFPPREQASAFYLHAIFAELGKRSQAALRDMERAVALDPDNHDYLLELYTLRARLSKGGGPEGQDDKVKLQNIAKMYYFLGEGEKLIQQGKYQDALVPFLQARQANDASYLPLVKMGDMFNNINDVENARINYKLASDRAPNNISVWSRYIDSLIQSYEWDEASKAMDRFRKLPVSQSSIDKAAADMNQKQGHPLEAQVFYKKAMSREGIDSSVYAAYARSLMSTRNFKDAPFFFSLALRFDPLNASIKVDIAKCLAETESIERAIGMLQEEMARSKEPRPEYLAAIAEFQMQKGSWEEAKYNIAQAMQIAPNYAYPWKLQAQIFMNQEASDKTALDKALAAFSSYSERNHSDPTGYLERYKIFARRAEFEKAKGELEKIFAIYPKYPNSHYFMGALYSLEGNHRVAADEFKRELENNPESFQSLLAYGRELMELNQPDNALGQFRKAMEVNPRSPDAKQEAGWANLALKNYQAAVSLIRGAIELDQGNPLLYKRLGLVYRSMNDLTSACSAFKKYLEMEPDAADKADFSSCF